MSIKDCIQNIRLISQTLEDDDPDKKEMMDIEGDYTDLINWALVKRAENIAQANAAKELIDRFAARKRSFENKADSMKDIIQSIMDAANESKFKSECGTVSIRSIKPKPIVTDEMLIPNRFFKRTVDKTAINKAIKDGEEVLGVSMDNGGTSLTIR